MQKLKKAESMQFVNKLHHSELKKASKKDIKKMIDCFNDGELEKMHNTTLYINYSCLYCYLLEVFNQLLKNPLYTV